jgi:hypothetical protein
MLYEICVCMTQKLMWSRVIYIFVLLPLVSLSQLDAGAADNTTTAIITVTPNITTAAATITTTTTTTANITATIITTANTTTTTANPPILRPLDRAATVIGKADM